MIVIVVQITERNVLRVLLTCLPFKGDITIMICTYI